MYIIQLRNYAICLGGDTQKLLRDTLQEAIRDVITTVRGGANRSGTILCLDSDNDEGLLSFYSCNGDHVRYTDYRQDEIEKRFGIISSSFTEDDVARLSKG